MAGHRFYFLVLDASLSSAGMSSSSSIRFPTPVGTCDEFPTSELRSASPEAGVATPPSIFDVEAVGPAFFDPFGEEVELGTPSGLMGDGITASDPSNVRTKDINEAVSKQNRISNRLFSHKL